MHDQSAPTSRTIRTRVLIVGAGPVGLTLAMDLARRGIAVVAVEVRRAGEPPSVKCNHVSSRSMEIFRRLGVAQGLRDAGPPAEPVIGRRFAPTRWLALTRSPGRERRLLRMMSTPTSSW